MGAPSRRGATSNWGLPEGGHQAVREPGASGGFQREGTRPSESRERLGASRGPGGPGSPGPEDRSPSPRLPAGPAGTRRARTRLSLEPGGCSPPAGHSPWTQDGQHSPSTNQGSAHVAGGQLIWWQTVLNFYEEKRHFVVFVLHAFRNRNAEQGPERKDLEGPLVMQTRGHFSPQLERLPGLCPPGTPTRSTKPGALHAQQWDRWDGRCSVSRLPGETEWVNKETKRPAELWALTLPQGSVLDPRPSQDRAASDTGGALPALPPVPHHWATLARPSWFSCRPTG